MNNNNNNNNLLFVSSLLLVHHLVAGIGWKQFGLTRSCYLWHPDIFSAEIADIRSSLTFSMWLIFGTYSNCLSLTWPWLLTPLTIRLIGITGTAINWFKEYLSKRFQNISHGNWFIKAQSNSQQLSSVGRFCIVSHVLCTCGCDWFHHLQTMCLHHQCQVFQNRHIGYKWHSGSSYKGVLIIISHSLLKLHREMPFAVCLMILKWKIKIIFIN